MEKVLFKNDTRGFTNHEWLKSYHIFNFANFYNEDRMGFGNLRVFNEDFVNPEKGFGNHAHDNIEIISIPLDGLMAHKDTLGNEYILKKGDVQILSAGSGLSHSKSNPSQTEKLNLLQMWILPDKFNSVPSCQSHNFSLNPNNLCLVISPDGRQSSLKIQQHAFLYLGMYSAGQAIQYTNLSENNGLFLFIIQGKVKIAGEKLHSKDAIGIRNSQTNIIDMIEGSYILLLDISMSRR